MKQLKKVKVLMLPTEKASNTDIMPGKLCTSPRYNNGKQPLIFGEFENSYFNECVPQHLYLVSEDEEIKEGDWIIGSFMGTLVCRKVTKYYGSIKTSFGDYWSFSGETHQQLSDCKKVIATTNKSLLTKCDCPKLQNVCTSINGCKELPQIPESFVEAFVKADGKINEVMVEYKTELDREAHKELINTLNEYDVPNCVISQKPKTRDDNTVIVSKVKSDKQYTREDIKRAFLAGGKEGFNASKCKDFKTFDEWIEENL